jgi:hypothetical protein
VIGADDLRVTHPCASDSEEPLDLHVLGMPPAFVLSQDQTLRCRVFVCYSFPGSQFLKEILKGVGGAEAPPW